MKYAFVAQHRRQFSVLTMSLAAHPPQRLLRLAQVLHEAADRREIECPCVIHGALSDLSAYCLVNQIDGFCMEAPMLY